MGFRFLRKFCFACFCGIDGVSVCSWYFLSFFYVFGIIFSISCLFCYLILEIVFSILGLELFLCFS